MNATGSRPNVTKLAVNDVAAAAQFYSKAFNAEILTSTDESLPAGAVCLALQNHPGVPALCVLDERSYEESAARYPYDKGRTPRMELRVDDVRQWLERAVRAGATVRVKLVLGQENRLRAPLSNGEPLDYAHLIDPFGHLWALAAAAPC